MTESLTIQLDVEPIGKPRMTQRDKWKGRKCVVEYHAFKDRVRLEARDAYDKIQNAAILGVEICAVFPVRASWTKAAKQDMAGRYHRSKPDIDNIIKACFDALFVDDSVIARVKAEKWWGDKPSVTITVHYQPAN